MPEGVIQPKVSVVIPTYNRERLLLEAVESCRSQTFSNLQIVIVDDGSTDETGECVDRMLNSSWANACVTYQRQDNAGASSARNRGILLARGKYVQFLDSDDLLMPTKVARQVAVLESSEFRDAPCCHCFGTISSHTGSEGPKRTTGMQTTDASALIRGLCSRAVHVLSTPAPLWRRDHLMRYPGWREDIRLGDDLEYYARLLTDAGSVGFVAEELFFIREHGGDRLGVSKPTVDSVSSLRKARRSVLESAKRAGLWDDSTQEAFLGAMRTIYANALETRDGGIISDLERWMLELASAPKRHLGVKAMIGLRRLLGGGFLLGAHRMARRLRAV